MTAPADGGTAPSNRGPDENRAPHAILDPASRQTKARKIHDILRHRRIVEGADILDIGAGSGHIAAFFAQAAGPGGSVAAVDRVNQLRVASIAFRQAEGTLIPFDDQHFDLVITNHLIEHVGERPAQLEHLREIRRVLRSDGVVYLAVPNRWSVMEHHFNLPFLSWLPQPLASVYVRLMGRGTHYDCTPLSRGSLRRLFDEAGLTFENVTIEALHLMAEQEFPRPVARFLSALPHWTLRLPMLLVPTHVALGARDAERVEGADAR